MKINYPQGATPLDPNEIDGLILTHVTTKNELDRFEQDNINDALSWLEERKPKEILNDSFMKRLHKRMFKTVWKWAGEFRRTEKNLGVPWHQISVELKKMCDDVEYWIENETFSADEIAARFHRRLVWIHLFPNGNGRHARLMTDLLLEITLGKPRFTWGGANLENPGGVRKRYIDSLKDADNGDYAPLVIFARS